MSSRHVTRAGPTPDWLNTRLIVAGVLAAIDRALQMKYLDSDYL